MVKRFFTLILIVILCFGAGLALSYYMAPEGEKYFLLLIQSQYTLLPVVIGGGLYLIHFMTKLGEGDKNKGKLGSKTKEGKELSQFFDSRWVTEKELKSEKKFMYCTWNSVRSSGDGILLKKREVEKGK